MRHEAGGDSHHKRWIASTRREMTRGMKGDSAYPNSDRNIYVGNVGVDGRDNSEGRGVCQLHPFIRGNSDKPSYPL